MRFIADILVIGGTLTSFAEGSLNVNPVDQMFESYRPIHEMEEQLMGTCGNLIKDKRP
jgi:hypothetical protein